jgi:hypothetical protein
MWVQRQDEALAGLCGVDGEVLGDGLDRWWMFSLDGRWLCTFLYRGADTRTRAPGDRRGWSVMMMLYPEQLLQEHQESWIVQSRVD